MYHLHCAECGRFVLATASAEQAKGEHTCPKCQPVVAVNEPTEPTAFDGLDAKIAELLTTAGFALKEQVQAANDTELLAITGIGPKTLQEIRQWTS